MREVGYIYERLIKGDVTRDDSQPRATRRCNVGTMLCPFETMSEQCCNAGTMLPCCVALKIVVANGLV